MSPCGVQAGLEPSFIRPSPPQCWDYKPTLIFFFFLRFILSFIHVYVCGHVHVSAGAYRSQTRASDPLEPKVVWGVHCGSWELTSGPLQAQQVLLPPSHLCSVERLPSQIASSLIKCCLCPLVASSLIKLSLPLASFITGSMRSNILGPATFFYSVDD